MIDMNEMFVEVIYYTLGWKFIQVLYRRKLQWNDK